MMKKMLKFSLMLVAILVFSCMETELTVSNSSFNPTPSPVPCCLTQISPSLDMQAFAYAVSNLSIKNYLGTDAYINRDLTTFYFNTERLIRTEGVTFKNNFGGLNLDVSILAKDIIDKRAAYVPASSTPLISHIPGATSVFNSTQLSILDTYVAGVYNCTNGVQYMTYHKAAKDKIDYSTTLTRDQKIMALSVITIGMEIAGDFFMGKWNDIQTDINGLAVGTSGGCSVNWRSVWAGAVVGGTSGAIAGAYLGASGGTVVFPGLGTASGAVGCGVFGFALGFISGVTEGVASELLTSCFRKARMDAPLVDCDKLSYFQNHIEDCTRELNDHKYWYLLTN